MNAPSTYSSLMFNSYSCWPLNDPTGSDKTKRIPSVSRLGLGKKQTHQPGDFKSSRFKPVKSA